MDLYVCSKCRRVELYAAEPEEPLRTEREDQVTLPGVRHQAQRSVRLPHLRGTGRVHAPRRPV